mgnify:CR=1 FL=1
MKLRAYLIKNYSTTAISNYEKTIQRYVLTLGEKAETATHTDVLDYIGLLRKQQLHPKTLRNNLFAIKIYYRYLVFIGKRTDHPCQFLYLKDQINRQIHLEKLYTKEALSNFYSNYKANNAEHQQRNKIILSLLIYQALITIEITQLKVKDLNLEEGTIVIKGNTKNKGRTLGLKPNQILLFHEYLKKEYKNYWRKQKPSKRVDHFLLNESGLPLASGGINRIINQKGASEKFTPLKIRQSIIARLLKENKDIRIVQEFAGHRRASSTEAYKQTGLEELKQAIELLHPLQ